MKKAFTLIELLVCLAIIGMLGAVVLSLFHPNGDEVMSSTQDSAGVTHQTRRHPDGTCYDYNLSTGATMDVGCPYN